MSIINLNIKNRFYDMYNLAVFVTSLHMDVVTESSGDLFYLETEDIEHFLIKCICLADIRNKYFRTLKCYLDRIKRNIYNKISPKNLFTLFSLFNYMSIINLNIKNRFYDMYNLAEFLTSLHMDVVTESSGDLFNVHVVVTSLLTLVK
jgi:hypothetical protein